MRALGLRFVAAFLVLFVELSLVVGLSRGELSSVWEVQFGALWLAPFLIVMAAGATLGGSLLIALAERAAEKAPRLGLSAVIGLSGALVAWGVGGGRHLSALPRRAGFALGVAVLAALAAYALGPGLGRLLRKRPAVASALALLGIVVSELANRFLLVRLYPAFHLALAALALLLAPALAQPFLGEPGGSRSRARFVLPVVALLAVAAAVAGLRPAAERLARFDNFRLVMLDAAPLAGHAVLGAAKLAEPVPIAACEGDGCLPAVEGPTQRSVDLRGRDVLLVTIDALRADHVSAYGYGRKTTPAIDALAQGGARFTHAYAPTPHTSYSVTSLMTGKYMRPLLLQGAGEDSDTWASLLRTYAYRTAGFYPPAVFFIDPERFAPFRDSFLGFEFRKVEFLEGQARVDQVARYLAEQPPDRRVFVWVHLFGPHEPYQAQPGFAFGDRDVDRYDSEIAAADATAGKLAALMRARDPKSVVIVTSDHGEEFGEHGGRYHGTSVYEEQVRVPLVISAPGAIRPATIPEVVQSIDLLPTLLGALDIPRPPRLRGRDLGPLLDGSRAPGAGLALAETEEQALLAEGPLRLVCQRKLGACQLFDVLEDPGQRTDLAGTEAGRFKELRTKLRELSASHGRFEVRGLRAEGKGWPAALLRGISGDGDAAEDVAALLDDSDRAIRSKAAEVLFELRRPETAPALRLALTRDEDEEVRRWCALALTRMDQGAPLVYELVKSGDRKWQRLAALALAESGDARGQDVLVAWWRDAPARDYSRSRDLLDAFARIRSKDAVYPLVQSLDDVRLRPYIAEALAKIGDEAARGPLAKAFATERYQSSRLAIARALVELDAEAEMAQALVRFLGVPDPLPEGLDLARRAKILEQVGGLEEKDRKRLEKQSGLGVKVQLVVPRGGNGKGTRLLLRVHAPARAGEVRVGAPVEPLKYDRRGQPIKERKLPQIHPTNQVRLQVPAGPPRQLHVTLPESLGARPGRAVELVVFADGQVGVESVAVVPLADELPPPPPGPWQPARTPSPGR